MARSLLAYSHRAMFKAASNLDILKKTQGGENSKLMEKLNNSRKKLKVWANFDNQVTKYLSNRHKNPSFALY